MHKARSLGTEILVMMVKFQLTSNWVCILNYPYKGNNYFDRQYSNFFILFLKRDDSSTDNFTEVISTYTS